MSRDTILNKIRQNRPKEWIEAPQNIQFLPNFDDNVSKFVEVLRGISGDVSIQNNTFTTICDYLKTHFPEAKSIANTIKEIAIGNVELEKIKNPHDLALIDLAILRGQFGVAENGAIWLDETNFGGHRVLPFITQQLVIVLDKKQLVANMHQAYLRLDTTQTGFGVFLAGPSKTADIEQSLVIGAHGARSLMVFLMD